MEALGEIGIIYPALEQINTYRMQKNRQEEGHRSQRSSTKDLLVAARFPDKESNSGEVAKLITRYCMN
jgi:hypothetical protein